MFKFHSPTEAPLSQLSLTAPLREGSQNKSLHEVAQHVLEDAAITVVVGLTGRVDADHRVELGLGAVLVGGGDVDRLGGHALVELLDAGDIVGLGAVEAQGLIGFA